MGDRDRINFVGRYFGFLEKGLEVLTVFCTSTFVFLSIFPNMLFSIIMVYSGYTHFVKRTVQLPINERLLSSPKSLYWFRVLKVALDEGTM